MRKTIASDRMEAPKGAAARPLTKTEREMMLCKDSIFCCWGSDSGVMAFFFSGMPPLMDAEWTPFQFVKTTTHLDADKVYVRDPRRAWYHLGLEPFTNAVDDTGAFFAEMIVERQPRRIIAMGASSGGFAALLYGWLLNVDEVHAFAPRTYVDIDNRLKYDDFFMDEYLEQLYLSPFAQQEYFDLRPIFMRGDNLQTQFHIYYSTRRRLDITHAHHISGHPNITYHEYEEGGHRIASYLRQTGELKTILDNAIAGKTAHGARVHA